MLQKLFSSPAFNSTPVDLPSPPTVDQMIGDLSKLCSNDPIFQLASLNYFAADFVADQKTKATAAADDDEEETSTPSLDNENILRDLSKLSMLCNEIRDVDAFLKEKRVHLQSLTRTAMEKRDELEGIVSWTTAESADKDEGDGDRDAVEENFNQ